MQSGKKALQVDTEFLKFFNGYVKEGKEIPSVERAFIDFYQHIAKEYDKVIKKYKRLGLTGKTSLQVCRGSGVYCHK